MTLITYKAALSNEMKDIYTVSRLNQETQLLLEGHFSKIWISGEISNLSKAASGHYYFSLKDATCQIRCAYFKNRQTSILNEPSNGMQILALAKVSLYTNRGDYQLIIDSFQEEGIGLLQIEFENLKRKLANLGLFEAHYKQALPSLPSCIGVITSAQGAALRDILITLNKRFCSIPVIIYPTEVQGKTAAPKIAKAIQVANLRKECDVLILARGGGTLEDLWPFNEEIVAQAIFASKIPIVSGVGHQTDSTIADYVADLAAATPTAAAAAVCPNLADWLLQFNHLIMRIEYIIERKINLHKTHLLNLTNRLKDPQTRITHHWQTLDRVTQSLQNVIQTYLINKKLALSKLNHQLLTTHPHALVKQAEHQLQVIKQRLLYTITNRLTYKRQQFENLIATLHAVSPLATLERGYAIAMTSEHHIINSSKKVKINDDIILKLAHGNLLCAVKELMHDK